MANVLKEGLSKSEPSSSDASTKLPTKASVNSDAVRSGVAATPKSLGGRTA